MCQNILLLQSSLHLLRFVSLSYDLPQRGHLASGLFSLLQYIIQCSNVLFYHLPSVMERVKLFELHRLRSIDEWRIELLSSPTLEEKG
jgi:hypothetical protein